MKTLLLIKALIVLARLAQRGKLIPALRAIAASFPEAVAPKNATGHAASLHVPGE